MGGMPLYWHAAEMVALYEGRPESLDLPGRLAECMYIVQAERHTRYDNIALRRRAEGPEP